MRLPPGAAVQSPQVIRWARTWSPCRIDASLQQSRISGVWCSDRRARRICA